MTSDDGETETDASSGGENSDEESGELFSSRSDAIAFAGAPATAESLDLDRGDDRKPDGITFSESSSGTSSTSGPDESTYTAVDINVESTRGETIDIDGNSDFGLRVTDLTQEASATFTLDPGFDDIAASRIQIDTRGGGELREETPRFYDESREESATYLPGTWSGDVEMFSAAPFGEYVVSLLENGSVIAETASEIHGMGYRWRFDQTEDAAFFTRHGSVDAEWEAVLRVGEAARGPRPDPDSVVVATHRPDNDVFEADLTQLDIESGRYDWTLELREPNAEFPYHAYLTLRGMMDGELLIP
ncbi:MAG: hypothetical protein ACQEQJ_04670 [Halobacteriota archaeon]